MGPDFGQGRFLRTRNFFTEQFEALDYKKRGYIEKSQEKDNHGYPFLFHIFPIADRDGDGKLTRKELNDYLALQGEGANCFVQLQVTDHEIGRAHV